MARKKEIFNSIDEAKAYLDEAPELLEKAKNGRKVAKVQLFFMIMILVSAIASGVLISIAPKGDSAVTTMGYLLLTIPALFQYVAIAVSIVAYHKGGGFGKYMNTFKEIAKWGWLLIPIFPADLCIALLAIACGLSIMLYFPLAFISMHVNSIRKNTAAAEAYIRRNQQAVAFA